MMYLLLALSLVFFGIVSAIYLLYFLLVLRTNKKKEYIELLDKISQSPSRKEDLPNVTILIPAYNEEETLHDKMRNISEFDYPLEKIEVLVLDDYSTDKTREVASNAFEAFGLKGRILSSEKRQGVNALYNSDADALMLPETLLKSVKIMSSLEDVGGVAAKMTPTHTKTTASTRSADAYTDAYYAMLEAESAIFSTFPGGSSCMLVRKSAFAEIPPAYGSSDGNISLTIIKKGFKFILAPCVPFFEPMSQRFGEMRRQKVRRAARLIQATLLKRDILFSSKYGAFGKTIFPLRLLMMTIAPPLALLSIFLFFAFAYTMSLPATGLLLAAAIIILLLGTQTNMKIPRLIVSFLIHQTYLLAGFVLSFKKMGSWSHIERVQS
jgi:cellulose synthase/poly-beta-1,6-N-acetylglucosamine synthase-like glycosyltransferase